MPGHANPPERVFMNARRIAAPEAQKVNSAGSLQDQTILGLYPELVRVLRGGVVLLLLEDTSDVKILSIIHINRTEIIINSTITRRLVGHPFDDVRVLS